MMQEVNARMPEPASPSAAAPEAAGHVPNAQSTTVPVPPWLTRPDREARRRRGVGLDRDGIVAEALRIVDADGVDAVSIRRLADALGVTPMALYWHVRDKAELLELVGQAVIAGVEVPEQQSDWRDDLRAVHLGTLD